MSHSLTIICIYSVKKDTLTCNVYHFRDPAPFSIQIFSEFYIFFCNKIAKHAQKALSRCLRRAWFADFGAPESRLSPCWRTMTYHAVLCDWLFKSFHHPLLQNYLFFPFTISFSSHLSISFSTLLLRPKPKHSNKWYIYFELFKTNNSITNLASVPLKVL